MWELFPYDKDGWYKLHGNEETEKEFEGYALSTLDELDILLYRMDDYGLLDHIWFLYNKDKHAFIPINYTNKKFSEMTAKDNIKLLLLDKPLV